ncbi:MAG: thiamine phosphate synthase [Deltaproteobacteria bacterium]|nr:thiamine phosphate synthase [Deltaproteobacteria bacterium]
MAMAEQAIERPGNRIRGLYVITDEELVPGRTHRLIAQAAVAGGARIVQLRDKRRSTDELTALARELLQITRPAGALLIVNDRVEVAAAAGADGVHLGVGDASPSEARALLGPGAAIGFSPETEEQALAARDAGTDYLGVGAIYGTGTKPDAGPPVGTARISRLRVLTGLPIVAIGGITAERVPEVMAAGASAVAVISAVVAAPDPEAEARRLCRLLERWSAAG